jgi:hypothetical protein
MAFWRRRLLKDSAVEIIVEHWPPGGLPTTATQSLGTLRV